MVEVQRFTPDTPADEILAAFTADGAAIIESLLPPDQLDALVVELGPWIDGTPDGRDDFTGRLTARTGALVARSPLTRPVVMHDLILGLARQFLAPYTTRIQLHLTQTIKIGPGQGTQPLHRDRLAWGGYIPREIEPQFSTMWALTDFTAENGATRVVPGSNKWDDERRATADEKTQATMPAGSVLLYSGSVIHSGGENRTEVNRVGANITYCLGWLRTEENQYLSCPPHVAKDLDPELQELMGYTQGEYALGYYSDPDGPTEKTDILPPEFVLGRAPSKRSVPNIAQV